MKASPARVPRAFALAVPLLLLLYFYDLTGTGLLGPDEPRYASIGREMARSGDWITPRLWGEPWFEKPALLYWMTAAAFRAGLGEDLAPRVPVAAMAVVFLVFYWRLLAREFGLRAASFAAAILGTSAMWLGFAHVGVTDLPMTAAFAAGMLLALEWIGTGNARRLPLASALLGAAVLAKGLVPLVLAAPLAWSGRRHLRDLPRARVAGPFLLVALPWYLLCYVRNGVGFLRTFFWEHHFGRFASEALQHGQPFWFYIPVLAAALLPWAPLLALLFQRRLYADARCRFLGLWALFAFLFFSASANKLPGYLLPVMPAAAALAGVALERARRARAVLALSAAALISIPVLGHVLPQALAAGLSRSERPPAEWSWLLPPLLALGVWRLESAGRRGLGVAALAAAAAVGAVYLKVTTFPALDQAVSARPLWRRIAGRPDEVCVARMHRSWRYGLNYYSVTPLPDCAQQPRPWQVVQEPGRRPDVVRALP